MIRQEWHRAKFGIQSNQQSERGGNCQKPKFTDTRQINFQNKTIIKTEIYDNFMII